MLRYDAVLSPLYSTLQQVRGSSRMALTYLRQYEPTSSNLHQAEMYFTIAFAEMQLGEDFCNGIALGETIDGVPQYSGLSNSIIDENQWGIRLDWEKSAKTTM